MKVSFFSVTLLGAASAAVNQTTCGKNSYSYNALAGYGFVPSNAKDKFGDTLGGFGSSIAVDQSSWKILKNGSYTGTLWAIPDRGWNTQGTLNYQSRIHKFGILFTPNNTASVASPAPTNLAINYQDTILFVDSQGTPFTGLDPNGIKTVPGFPPLPQATYPGDGFGGTGTGGSRVSMDSEGLVLIPGGGFWISDEYGPHIYRFGANGKLQAAIAPPPAFIPRRNNTINFSSNNPPIYNPSQVPNPINPQSGRANNQGFEGLTISPDGKTLSVLLQSALIQDGALDDATAQNTRLLTYDVSNIFAPKLKKEFVVPLPLYVNSAGKTRTAGQSEIHAVTETDYLVLSRDSGRGFGQGPKNTRSVYRHIDVFSIEPATNVKGSSADNANGTVAPAGKVNPGITPARYCTWLDFNVNSELGKFGLHNGGAEDSGLLNVKWESLAIVPVVPQRTWFRRDVAKKATSQDVYIISISDNDFITQDGTQNFGRFQYKDAGGYNIQSQALVFQATIPDSGQASWWPF